MIAGSFPTGRPHGHTPPPPPNDYNRNHTPSRGPPQWTPDASQRKRRLQENVVQNRAKQQRTSNTWQQYETVWWKDFTDIDLPDNDTDFNPSSPDYGKKILVIDLDGTIITTKSGRVFPTDKFDWRFWSSEQVVLTKLRESYLVQRMKIVLVSNQRGVSLQKATIHDITQKVDAIQDRLQIPMQVFLSTIDDNFRKPCTGIWDFLKEKCNKGVPVDESQCLVIGDAAGRPAGGTRKRKDFSGADLKFAMNLDIKFSTPDAFFLSRTGMSVPTRFSFHPSHLEIPSSEEAHKRWTELVAPKQKNWQEVIIMVGPPGCGKSTLASSQFESYGRVNQDTLKTRDKCVYVFKQFLADGKSVVVDNMNRDSNARKTYIDIAKNILGCGIRAIYFNISEELCFHLNSYRSVSLTQK